MFLALLLIVACSETPSPDVDGDGHSIAAGDCNDADAAVFPGAEEVCDEIDNDCDGQIDDLDSDISRRTDNLMYRDQDGDGFGDMETAVNRCQPIEGYVQDNTDCDDYSAMVNPEQNEVCDGLDNDCDGVLPDLEVDQDLDGFMLCAGDCDDADPLKHPDRVEICNGVDDDCDGALADFESDLDGDGQWACEDDCDDANPTIYLGALESCDGIDNDCDSVIDDNCWLGRHSIETVGHRFAGENGDDLAGRSVSAAGDVNGDGFSDFLVGAELAAGDQLEAGAAYLILGGAAFSAQGSDDLSIADARFLGSDDLDYFGCSITSLGDLDLDGHDDIAIGAHGVDGVGAVYIFHGPLMGDIPSSTANTVVYGVYADDLFGASVSSAGDIDGDGFLDVLVGAPGASDVAGEIANSGMVALFSGPFEPNMNYSDASARFYGSDLFSETGASVASVGDVNGDGLSDILIGSPGAQWGVNASGGAHLIRAPFQGDMDLADAHGVFQGENPGDRAGSVVASAGDVNGDGYADLLIGSPEHSPSGDAVDSQTGVVYMIFGQALGVYQLRFDSDATFHGDQSGALTGYSVSSVGDVNSDGFDDVLIGSPKWDGGGINSGGAHLFLGPINGHQFLNLADATLMGSQNGVHVGGAVAGAGDINSDGFDDLLIGSAFGSGGNNPGGGAFVLLSVSDL